MKVKASDKVEISSYIEETLKLFQDLKLAIEKRNKTARIKAMRSIITIVENRLDATLKYSRAGGTIGLDSTMLIGLYNPILEYLVDEVTS